MAEREAVLRQWEAAAERIHWERRWETLYAPGPRGGRWLGGATLNVAENCLDRHAGEDPGRNAFHWEGEPGDRRTVTYGELHADVCALAAAFMRLGVGRGDRVAIHLGLVPEAIVTMLACARLGAVHALMASPLPADALADRLADLDPKLVVTQDGAWRHGVIIPLKARADEAMAAAAAVEHTVVVRRTGAEVDWYEGDRWYHDLLDEADALPAEPLAADHPLLIAYTVTRRGRPTGVVHGSGGYLLAAATLHDDGLASASGGVFWMPSDIAWFGTQTHAIYGPLACGATSVMFEGMLDTPTHARAWEMIERYRVTTLVVTPSTARILRSWADTPPRRDQLGSLQRIVTAGERRDTELRDWLLTDVGAGEATLADGWGQTELGGIVTVGDRAAELPDPGADVVDDGGRSVGAGVVGQLVLRNPWPGTFQGIWRDDETAAERYWQRSDGAYATGDRARREPDGSLTLLGRIDPVVSVSAQLVSLTEVSETVLEHPFVDAAHAFGCSDPRTHQAAIACLVIAPEAPDREELARALRTHTRERLGGLAQPRVIAFVEALPDDVPREQLGEAAALLCARSSAGWISISPDQLEAAVRTVGG